MGGRAVTWVWMAVANAVAASSGVAKVGGGWVGAVPGMTKWSSWKFCCGGGGGWPRKAGSWFGGLPTVGCVGVVMVIWDLQ